MSEHPPSWLLLQRYEARKMLARRRAIELADIQPCPACGQGSEPAFCVGRVWCSALCYERDPAGFLAATEHLAAREGGL